MSKPNVSDRQWDERASVNQGSLTEHEAMFQQLFEHSADAIFLFDPGREIFVDCNQAAVGMMRATSKQQLLLLHPAELSPELQPDGKNSRAKTPEMIGLALEHGSHRFEWVARRMDGTEFPLEVLLTTIQPGAQPLMATVCRDITERKAAESALRESEQKLRGMNQSLERRVEERTAALTASEARFRAMVEHAPEAIVVFDGNTGRFLFGNEHACRLYGVPMEKLAALTPADVSPEFQPGGRRSSELAHEMMEQAQAGGTLVFEWTHQRPDGRLIPTEVRLLRLPAEGQNLIRASIIDNTESHRAQRALRESEVRFSAAFHSSPVITGITRASDGKFVLANDASLEWSGYRNEEVIGRTALELGVWESAAERDRFWDAVRRSGSVRERECRLRDRHGHVSTMLGSGAIIVLNGEDHLLFMMVDISERKRAEAELQASEARLRESEARFSAAFHASPIITAISRASDARFVLANDAFLHWAGYERDEVLGRTANELGIWENSVERQRFWDEVRSAGSVRARECRLRNRSGKYSTMLASGVVISFNGQDHLLGIMLDISPRKQAEAELHRTLAREQELSQLKSNFVSMVSHEFRTPLGIIQSSAELLRDFYERMPPPDRIEQLESISRNTRRMAGMMEEILVLSRLDAGKLDFEPAALDLSAFFRRMVDEVLSATHRRCPIELSLASVPPVAQADERLLGHIFTNLLSNAVKYSEPGATVSLAVECDGADAVCIVRDRGIGIAEQDQEQLFKAFHRGSNVGTRPGTGLGLLVVKRCIELHRGRVQLVSRLGEGTTVTARLPVFGRADGSSS